MQIRTLLLIMIRAVTGLMTLQGSIMSLHASIESDYSPLLLHFEPLKLLNLNFNAVRDPNFHSNADPDHETASQNNLNPVPQPDLFPRPKVSTLRISSIRWGILP
jgi:hypothetical protein